MWTELDPAFWSTDIIDQIMQRPQFHPGTYRTMYIPREPGPTKHLVICYNRLVFEVFLRHNHPLVDPKLTTLVASGSNDLFRSEPGFPRHYPPGTVIWIQTLPFKAANLYRYQVLLHRTQRQVEYFRRNGATIYHFDPEKWDISQEYIDYLETWDPAP
jgi:hypothetical protein